MRLMRTRARWGCALVPAVVLALTLMAARRGSGQEVNYARGQNIAPSYEGWTANPDGSFDLLFGYFNRNFEESLYIPIGPDNRFEPGDVDRGQPTYFQTRRNWYVFRVRVAKDFGNNELVWTVTANGKSERAYATLKPDYILDNSVIFHTNSGVPMTAKTEHNQPPVLKLEGDLPRTARVGEPLSLTAFASDDGIPPPRPTPKRAGPTFATRLRVAWFVYRGDGRTVTFDPEQFEIYQDYKGNSPFASGWLPPPLPPDGKFPVQVTFSAPGEYVIQVMAHDGGFGVTQNVTVTVNP